MTQSNQDLIIFCRKDLIGLYIILIPVLRQIQTSQIQLRYILSPIPVLHNPNFPPKYTICGTPRILRHS